LIEAKAPGTVKKKDLVPISAMPLPNPWQRAFLKARTEKISVPSLSSDRAKACHR
jgi:hypothetical protein